MKIMNKIIPIPVLVCDPPILSLTSHAELSANDHDKPYQIRMARQDQPHFLQLSFVIAVMPTVQPTG